MHPEMDTRVDTRDGDGDNSGSDEECGPSLPSGVLRSRGGWAGEDLEMDHQRERLRAARQEDDDNDSDHSRSGIREDAAKKNDTHVAVDLSQFRNEEVGKGYKAKHVIRQREAGVESSSSGGVVDMSGGKFRSEGKKDGGMGASGSKRSAGNDGSSREVGKIRRKEPSQLDTYLQCKGVRDFRREIEKLLSRK